MTLYLTDNTPPAEIARARDSGCVHAVKLYPAGATTNSDAGVTDLGRCRPVLAAMERLGMPLLVHGEVTGPDTDVFDREKVFIDTVLAPLLGDFPALKVVFEHITTAEAVAFVEAGPATLAATITPHHLLYNRNHMLAGAIRPHFFCLPVLKRNTHQRALIRAATGGSPRFFLGTDSAPHARGTKECASGCAGIYSAHAALESYAAVFEAEGALARLEGVREPLRGRFLRPAAQYAAHPAAPRAVAGAAGLRVRRGHAGPHVRGRNHRLARQRGGGLK